MKTADQAFITPSVFTWAIARAKSDPEKLAKKLHTARASVTAWEEGRSLPTFSQAQKMAEALYIPLGYLFLPAPPDESIPLTDFRTTPGKRTPPSAELIDLVNDVLFKQQWYREFLLAQGARPLPFVGSFSAGDASSRIAESIRSTLAIDARLRQRSKGWNELFVSLIRNIEAVGILVMRSGVALANTHRRLSVKEFRGFAISDPIAPVIFVNGKDWPKAQLFTVAHELVHIWIGASGISNENLKGIELNNIERICNEVAAEVLVPASEFLDLWSDSGKTSENLDQVIHRFSVSTLVALRRAFDLQKISRNEYLRLYAREEKAFTEMGERRKGGGNFYNNVLARNSATLAKIVVQGATRGTVLYRDAARLLNISTPAVQKIARHLVKRKEGT
jgi:Zn-dependent peptidase ImmA (M78 family)/transcriptional regulator with XRE-family HTH domain